MSSPARTPDPQRLLPADPRVQMPTAELSDGIRLDLDEAHEVVHDLVVTNARKAFKL